MKARPAARVDADGRFGAIFAKDLPKVFFFSSSNEITAWEGNLWWPDSFWWFGATTFTFCGACCW